MSLCCLRCALALTKLTLTCALLLLFQLLLPHVPFGTARCYVPAFIYIFCYFVGKPNEIFTHFPFYILTCSCRSMLYFLYPAPILPTVLKFLLPYMNITFVCVLFAGSI